MKEINKQMNTERGLIQISREYDNEDDARKDGYSYMFTSTDLKAYIYGKALDNLGHRRECVIIYKKGE